MSVTQQLGFDDLIAPLTPADISALWRSRELKLQRRTDENRFAALFDWNILWRLIEDGILTPQECRVTYNRHAVPPVFYTDENKLNPERLARLLDQGTSLRVARLHTHVPAISAALRDAATNGIGIISAYCVVTSGCGGALKTHFDPEDLIILQVEGSKRWRIYDPRALEPLRISADEGPPQMPPLIDIVLERGDVLYMPSGYWHLCDNGPARSLHLALLLRPPRPITVPEHAVA
jgi:hypothetical protein